MRSHVLCIVLAASGLLACEVPRDPGDTLERVTGDTLRVGVSEAPPFVVRTDADPAGIEPDLIRSFARSIDATIVWVWGPTAEHMEALSHRDLDIVAAGLTAGTPWRSHVGLTVPYRPGFDTPGAESGGRRHVLAVPPGENRFLMALEDALLAARPGRHGEAS